MAAGGSSLLRGMATEPRVRASGSRVNRPLGGVDANFRFNLNWIGDKDEGRPNNYWDWKPSSTFADPSSDRQSTAKASAKKSKNKDRDKTKAASTARSSAEPVGMSPPDASLSSPSSREAGRRHTPATFPRTRNVASAMDRVELELLRQQLTFSDADDQSSDGRAVAANNVRRDVKSKTKKSPVQINHSDEASHSGVANQHGTWSTKESTIVNEMPDRNQIVARLMQIRDYMKQASSMMANLNISPTGSDEQAEKLMRLQRHLQEQERGYLVLLEQMLSDEVAVTAHGRSSHNSNESQSTSIAESASINIDAESDVSDATTGKMDIKTRLEELEGLRQQHELLQKMLQQQEELRALQNRQSALMKLQEDIEGKLKQSEDQNADTTSHSTFDMSAQSEHTDDPLLAPLAPFDRSRGGLPSLNEQRRELLMKILSEDTERRASDMQRARMLDRLDTSDRDQKEASAMSSEHEHLLSTLGALQQKKNHMDELLRQLQVLRPSIPGAAAADTDSAVSAASSSQLVDPAQEQQDEVKEAQLVGSSDENEAMDKLRRLQEVRHRLDDLRDLVQQYQGFVQSAPAAAAATSSSTLVVPGGSVDEAGDARKTSSSVNFEDPELMSNLQRLERGEPVGQFRQRNQELRHQLDATEDSTSSQQSEEDSQLMTTDTESNHSLLQTWGDDPEIRGKIEKLQEAKRKLHQLQELVTMVQMSPEAAANLPDDLAALAAGLQDDGSSKAEQDDRNEEDSEEEEEEEEDTNLTTSEMSEGGVPQVSQETREAYFEAKMQQQRRELDKLQEERQRLLAVQQQLRELNQQLPRMQQVVKSTNTTRQNPSLSEPSASNIQDTSTSNRETLIAEKLRHRRLQTELQLKQQELAALMDRVKPNNTGNVNSDSSSALGDSNDNDLFRVSMRSADVTAAASWGGSTQQSEDDDNDAYPSDGILQVEEEEEQELSLAGTTSTYTVEAAYRRPTQRPNSFPGQRIRNNTDLETLHGIRYPKWVSDPKMSSRHQQNLRTAEELMSADNGGRAAPIPGPEADRNFYLYQIHQLQQQLQNSINLSQSMMRDQQCMNNMLQSSMSGGFGGLQPPPLSAHTSTFGSTTPTPTNSDPRMANLMSDYNMRLQHQQLQLNMNYAYNQLYQQQLELQHLQNEAPAPPSNRAFNFEGSGEFNMNNNRMNGIAGYDPLGAPSPFGGGLYQPGGEFNMNNNRMNGIAGYDSLGAPSPFGGGLYQPGGEFNMNNNRMNAISGYDPLGAPSPFGGGLYQQGGEFNMNNNRMNGISGYDPLGAPSPFGGGLYQPGGEFNMNNNRKNGIAGYDPLGAPSPFDGGLYQPGGEFNMNNNRMNGIAGYDPLGAPSPFDGGLYQPGGEFNMNNNRMNGIAFYDPLGAPSPFGGGLYQPGGEFNMNNDRMNAISGYDPLGAPSPFGGGLYQPGGGFNMNNNRMNGISGYDPLGAPSPFGGGLYQLGGALDYTSPYSRMSAEASRHRQQQCDYDAYARHRQEQDARQRDYHVPPNTAQGSVDQLEDRSNLTNDFDGVPFAYAERAPDIGTHSQTGRARQPYVPPLDIQRLLEQSEKRRKLAQQGSASGTKRDGKKTNQQTDSKDSTTRPKSSSKPSPGPRPGLSSSLSGTAFMDVASVTSTMSMSSMPGEVERQTKLPDTQRDVMSTSEMESDAGSEFSLFEALRESIYSEVATLISQNETRPHYLIELFRELQMLNSDYLRQRALYSLQDLVAKFLTDEGVKVPTELAAGSLQPKPHFEQQQQQQQQQQQPSDPRMLWHLSTTASEQTPSESMITSDEEEIKQAQLYSMNPIKKKDKPSAVQSLGSVEAEEYDYVESVGSASSLSTPPSFSQDFGFANDELGDTVIHLDKALQRMREYERLKAEAEASAVISSDASASADKAAVSNSEVTSNSSAQDMGSESSFSDLPYPRIDTRQLDLQIKSIMQEVIPYLKEHMDDVCSPQLLSYIRRLVLTLSKQRDDSREFVRFFNRQLGSILQDSLAKFSGRKMRECGEDLLVDISEILFNELAFFRLMQDLDTAGSKLRQGEALGDEEEQEEEQEREGEEGKGEEDGATGTETGNETGTAAEDGSEDEGSSSEGESNYSLSDSQPPAASQPQQKPSFDEAELETAMDIATSREEEELGKTRDDDLARKLETSDKDEDSEGPLNKDQVKIELSMSESNAVTYLGSGEDDDELDELNARQDETITSIGAAASQVAQEKQVVDTRLPQQPPEFAPAGSEGNIQQADVSAPEKQPDSSSSSLPNGSMEAANDEVTIDELPSKMTSLTEVNLEGKASAEQDSSAVLEDIINTIVSGEAALAGDPAALKEPSTVSSPGVIGNKAEDNSATKPRDLAEVTENGAY